MGIWSIVLGCLALSQCSMDDQAQQETVVTFNNPTGNDRALGTMADSKNFTTTEPQELYKARSEAPDDDFLSDFVTPGLPLGATFVPDQITLAPNA